MESNMNLASTKNSIRLQSGLCDLSVIPRLFTIKTINNSCNFNEIILSKICRVIWKFLRDNPTDQQYNLDIEDKKSVLIKIGDIFQGKEVKFDTDEFETCRSISNKLNIAGFSEFINYNLIKQSSIINTQNLIWGSLRGNNSQELQSNDYFEYTNTSIKINEKKFSSYITKTDHRSFTIKTKKKEYKCNIFGVNYSSLIRDLNEKKWKNDFFSMILKTKIVNFNSFVIFLIMKKLHLQIVMLI